jgi:hypothetical protein
MLIAQSRTLHLPPLPPSSLLKMPYYIDGSQAIADHRLAVFEKKFSATEPGLNIDVE